MVTEIAPRHQREVFSPHPDDPYLSVEIGLYYLISRFRKQVGVLLRLRRDDLERRWCAAHSVGFPSRPGHAAYGGGRAANAYRDPFRSLRRLAARALDLRSVRFPFELRSSAHFPIERRTS